MELNNAAKEELQSSVSWTPITPDKCMPTIPECNPVSADISKFVLINSPGTGRNRDDELLAAIKERSKVLNGKLDCDSGSGSMAPSTPLQKGNPIKKRSSSFNLNERPLKKRRMRRHTPKILDKSKPKKIPKPNKIKRSTPKLGKPNARARAERSVKKGNKASDDSLERSIPETSPPELEKHAHTDPWHDVKSCRRALDFDLESETDVISRGDVEVMGTDCFNISLANPLNAVNEQALNTIINDAAKVHNGMLDRHLVDQNVSSTIGLENNLEVESNSQPNQGNEASINQDNHYSFCQDRDLKVYKRRDKSKIGVSMAGNEADCQNHHGTTIQTGSRHPFLKVYKRRPRSNIGTVTSGGNEAGFNQNDRVYECLNNSRKLTLNFPIICKKRRTTRRKAVVFKFLNTNYAENGLNKMTFGAKKMYRRGGAKKSTKIGFAVSKRAKKRHLTIAKGAKKRCSRYAMRATKKRLTSASDAERRIRFPNLNSQFAQDVLPTKFQIASAMADPKSFKCVFSVSPMVKSRRKRSIRPKGTNSPKSIYALTLPPLVMPKRKRSTLRLKKESTMHETSFDHSGSHPKEVLCRKPTLTQASVAEPVAQTCTLDSLCLNSEIGGINVDGSFIGQSAWDKIQERPRHKNLWPRSEVLTDLEWSVASLTHRLEKMRITDERTRTSNNSGQLVPMNPIGSIITHKKKSKPLKEKAAKADIDAESLRVGKHILQNEGEVDEELDKEKEIWWEEQRKIFQGRVDSFIARMRLVLGDRRFSQWNGSVVDSVVGVYLTQNVSDHLSSNAFMLLASEFPLQNKQEPALQGRALGMNEILHGTQEDTYGSQVTVTSCIPEVTTSGESDDSDDSGNEPIELPEMMSQKKDHSSKIPEEKIDWDELRRTYSTGRSSGLSKRTGDSVDWEAVRNADVNKIAEQIRSRGQSNVLAKKIKDFLNRLVEDHGSIDLEWLRDVPCERVKAYLLSIYGLGPKSAGCLRLLTLRHVAFPVDINVARVAVRLGWVPLQPLPDGVLMHLLEKYPVEKDIQMYLWPRLCKLDVLTLYELHYHMITFGKVFCTKKNPNCNACPLRADCRHFASAFASARLRLPGPHQKGVVPVRVDKVPSTCVPSPTLSLSSGSFLKSKETRSCEPIIEMPASPDQYSQELVVRDIEDFPYEVVEHEQEIPTIRFNTKKFRENVLDVIRKSKTKEFQGGKISTLHRVEQVSKELLLLSPEAASIPAPKLKNESRLRTEHLVYELPDSHPILSGFEQREPDDLCPYLLAIFRTGTACNDQNDQLVYGSILIPCRTANKGSFPLNGTYFQVNEVFADHKSSESLIPVPRESIWYLRQRPLLCGSSVSSIFKGMSTEDVQYCFWRGYVCVRGYDNERRAPRLLHERFHGGYKSKVKKT